MNMGKNEACWLDEMQLLPNLKLAICEAPAETPLRLLAAICSCSILVTLARASLFLICRILADEYSGLQCTSVDVGYVPEQIKPAFTSLQGHKAT